MPGELTERLVACRAVADAGAGAVVRLPVPWCACAGCSRRGAFRASSQTLPGSCWAAPWGAALPSWSRSSRWVGRKWAEVGRCGVHTACLATACLATAATGLQAVLTQPCVERVLIWTRCSPLPAALALSHPRSTPPHPTAPTFSRMVCLLAPSLHPTPDTQPTSHGAAGRGDGPLPLQRRGAAGAHAVPGASRKARPQPIPQASGWPKGRGPGGEGGEGAGARRSLAGSWEWQFTNVQHQDCSRSSRQVPHSGV